MNRGSPPSLARRLLGAQAVVIGAGCLTLVVTALLVAPGLFSRHLAGSGVNAPTLRRHAEAAFVSSFAISLALAAVAALLTAGLVSLSLVRRVAHPVERLAVAADAVAAGEYRVEVPDAGFSSELQRLSVAFTQMASRLGDTDAARSRLLSDLAHELRTPLATLEAFIDGIEDGVVPDDRASWATMRAQVARMRRLATDLRETAAADEHALGLVLGRCDPNAVAETAVASAGPSYRAKGVDVQLRVRPGCPLVQADSERMGQVLANLLDNALRHTRPGGHVELAVGGGIDVVRLAVRDDGDGLAPDQLEAVFGRFHRVDPARGFAEGGGSGLGLTIARAIVADHGGRLTAGSPGLGKGATFTVSLPVDPTPVRHPPAPA